MTKERQKQLESGWTPHYVQKRRWVCKPHQPADTQPGQVSIDVDKIKELAT